MDRTVTRIEKLSDWKREMKKFVRGVIKSKVFNDTDGKVNFVINKEEENYIEMSVFGSPCYAEFVAEVPKRVFNKVMPELFTKTIEQFNKLKNFAGMTVTFDN